MISVSASVDALQSVIHWAGESKLAQLPAGTGSLVSLLRSL